MSWLQRVEALVAILDSALIRFMALDRASIRFGRRCNERAGGAYLGGMTYRDDVAALAARHDALRHEVAQKTSELDQAARLLDDAQARARLPVLDNIGVASPCAREWAQMKGDDRTRQCGDCNKTVYDISSMTRDEAQALIVDRVGRLCVRYYRRADGTILTSDCTVGVSQKRRRRLIAAGAAVLLAGGGVAIGAVRAVTRGTQQEVMEDVTIGSEVSEGVEVRGSAAQPDDVHRDDREYVLGELR